jgi:hypothetical protein
MTYAAQQGNYLFLMQRLVKEAFADVDLVHNDPKAPHVESGGTHHGLFPTHGSLYNLRCCVPA